MLPVYLDYNATTPVDPQVVEAIRPYLEVHFGNPSSTHLFGVEPKIAILAARKQVASLLNAHSDEIIFTSGGSESNNFAIKGAAMAYRGKGNHIIASSVEHPAVAEVCHYLERSGFTVTTLPVDEFGMVNPEEVRRAITPGTIMVTVMHANNETGTIQPVEEIGTITRDHGILFHTDAAQSAGKIPVDVEKLKVDLLTVAGHKLYAPKGIGALYIRRGVKLEKLIHGADHESNQRAGTENVMQIAGLGKAAEIAHQILEGDRGHVTLQLRDRLHEGIRLAIPEVRLNGHPLLRLPNTLSLGFPGIEAAILLGEMQEVAASAGAACHAGDEVVSGVLSAMHVPMEFAMGTIRFSVGRMTTKDEIDEVIPIIVNAYRRLKKEPARMIMEGLETVPAIQVMEQGSRAIKEEIKSDVPAFRMTAYTHALGCACKIRPQLLEKILSSMPGLNNPAVLVGHETSDDAAVYRLDDQTAIVQTVDFIPPVVNDPYMYGAIAAANALSDVYAMGGKPLFALSIVGFPDKKLPVEVLQQILRGANEKVAEAGIQVIGGHSIEDNEPKFGLVVTGLVHPSKILRNSTIRAGDSLIITKPIGTGIITTAIKRGIASAVSIERVTRVMARLNRVPAGIMSDFAVNACTDVTGFGLLGHLKEMVCGSGARVILFAEKVPVMDEAWEYAAAGAIPGGSKSNLDFVKDFVQWNETVPELLKIIFADAQTSGGLLISLPENQASALLARLHEAGHDEAAIIGSVLTGKPGIIV